MGHVFNLTEGYHSMAKRARCPNCRQRVFRVSLKNGRGDPLSVVIPLWNLDRDAIAVCPKCRFETRVFNDAPPTTQPSSAWTLVSITEDRKEEEFLGDEVITVDNLGGSTSAERRITVNRSVTLTVSVDTESVRREAQKLSLGVDALGLEAQAEKSLTEKLATSASESLSRTEELAIEAPPRTKRLVTLSWKKVWQCGTAVFTDGKQHIQVPYRASSERTYDFKQVDSTA